MSPQLRTLVVLTLASLAFAIILGIIAVSESRGYRGEEVAAGLTVWSNYLLVFFAVSAVGALVLSGVERALADKQETTSRG